MLLLHFQIPDSVPHYWYVSLRSRIPLQHIPRLLPAQGTGLPEYPHRSGSADLQKPYPSHHSWSVWKHRCLLPRRFSYCRSVRSLPPRSAFHIPDRPPSHCHSLLQSHGIPILLQSGAPDILCSLRYHPVLPV